MTETLATPEGSAERSPHGVRAGSAPLCWEGGSGAGTAEDCGGLASGGRCAPRGRGAEAVVARRQLGPALLLLRFQLLHCPRLWKGLRLRSQARMELGGTHPYRDCEYTHSISVSILEITQYFPSFLWSRTDLRRLSDSPNVVMLSHSWDPPFLPPGAHVGMCVSPGTEFGVGGHRKCRIPKMGKRPAYCFFSPLSPSWSRHHNRDRHAAVPAPESCGRP